VLAVARGPGGGPPTWTLVVGPDEATLARDMQGLVAPSNWNEVEGRAAAFTPRGGAKTIAHAWQTYFIPTEALTPGNLRLITAGFMSANLDYYMFAFLVGAVLCGLASYVAVKAHGNRT
jgi:cellulose synthase operon protein B